MWKRHVLSILIAVVTWSCQSAPNQTGDNGSPYDPNPVATNIDPRLAQANNEFAFKLFAGLGPGDINENIFISPSSIMLALLMTMNGATGETHQQMADALAVGDMTREEVNEAAESLIDVLTSGDDKVDVAIANSLWSQYFEMFKEDFIERNRQYYDAETRAVDFEADDATDIINAWISDATRETITDMLEPPLDRDLVLMLINAIYFKGTWTYEFDPAKTVDSIFTRGDGSTVTLPMMTQDLEVPYMHHNSTHLIKLPYGDERFAMIIALPDQGIAIDDFLSNLTLEQWSQWNDQLAPMEGSLKLPRFTMRYKSSLVKSLKALGMQRAFDGNAQFSDMTDMSVCIDEVQHATFLKVNEEGTEASGVTVVEIRLTNTPGPFVMTLDRPFFTAIVDEESGAILFMGAVKDPQLIEE